MVLPRRGIGPLDPRVDRQQRGSWHAVLQPRPRRTPKRARSGWEPLVERTDPSPEPEDLRPCEVQPRPGHLTPPPGSPRPGVPHVPAAQAPPTLRAPHTSPSQARTGGPQLVPMVERVTGIEPASRAWRARPVPSSRPDATPMPQVRSVCDRPFLTVSDRQMPVLRARGGHGRRGPNRAPAWRRCGNSGAGPRVILSEGLE
jgi:hypothetical protein